ncbi:TonB-dependent receptor [Pontibacter sp. E15-1]|uniref:outer membrane beta-barrel protein n=1 Tax=Pontibacter sp. E15-1 TaxID=2919918 RepID=UPI001F4F8F14|nr:outer membrane beta-barrel protein [Pontibacter sp. E15-1]MCJ8164499.1 TonB-dependent receptor [Pontibacter sp. E15-1]
MKKILLLLFAVCTVSQVLAQGVNVFGTVQSATDKAALPGARVELTRITYNSKTGLSADANGNFKFEGVVPGMYTLEISYLGFSQLVKSVLVKQDFVNLGNLEMEESSTAIREVQVVGHVPLGEQKGDTTSYNAGAFKTAPDASAEDLVQKMPGVTIQDGTIQAQGQDVKQVLVDGKRFFEGDPSTALRNLPADIIASIEIFDKKSDQAELTGVSDGNEAKTINIVTKPGSKNGVFGKASAGYGTDNRYMLGASLNYFQGDRRITFTGITNNINMLDFSIGETPGGGMRGRRPPMDGGTTSGLIATNTFGLNYSDTWGDKVDVSGNYKFTQRDIQNNQSRVQQYILPADSGRVYTEDNLSNTNTMNHSFNLRLDYAINENNRLLYTPSLRVEQQQVSQELTAVTANDNGAINETQNSTASDNTSYTFENNLLFSHKFGLPGRTFSTSLKTSMSAFDGESTLQANTVYATDAANPLVQDQQLALERTGLEWEGEVAYTEPVGQQGQLQLQYTIGNQWNTSDRSTFGLTEQGYTRLDTAQTNSFGSDYLTQRFRTGYQHTTDKLRLSVGAGYQVAALQSEQTFPEASSLERDFAAILPDAQLRYKLTDTRNIDFRYNTSLNPPNVLQLQEVVDYTNPLQLTQGNAALQPSYQHSFRGGLRDFNHEANQVFFVGLFGNVTQNYIGNSITRAEGEEVALADGQVLAEGQQLVQPVNLDGYWNLRTFVHYGQPINFLSSNIGVRGSLGYTRTPGLSNGALSYVSSPNAGLGLTLSSNISENVDFTLSTNSTYNLVHNSLQPEFNSNYFNQNTNLKLSYTFWKGLVYRTELNQQSYAGLSDAYDSNYLLWNMSLSKKLFKNQQAEISLSVNDLLQQNVSLQRNLAAQYVEDVQSSALQRFFMLTFTYNLRNFGSGDAPRQERGFPDGPPPGGMPGPMPQG